MPREHHWYTEYRYVVPCTWMTSSNTTTATANEYTVSDRWGRYSYVWPRNDWTVTSNSTVDDWHELTYRGRPLYRTDSPEAVISIRTVADRPARVEGSQLRSAQSERAAARTAAQDRAEALLLALLPPDQREKYRLTGTFEVIGSHGTLYRVHRGVSGNVEWIKPDGSVGGRLCAHPDMQASWLPTADVLLSQLLALTTDEREFVRLANVHAGVRPHQRLRVLGVPA